MTDTELKELLSTCDPAAQQELRARAYLCKLKFIGPKISVRGLIEISNICSKNCFYCGIRRANTHVKRYRITQERIVEIARWAYEKEFGSLVIQSGEIQSAGFADYIENTLKSITAATEGKLGITISCGEQTPQVYERWRKAGASRYLLRIESSSPELYHQLHPADHDFNTRLACLKSLRELDYQVGSGVMIGFPGQTLDNLVRDLRFFEELDLDMIGMGPYIPHSETPLGANLKFTQDYRLHQLEIGLNMISAARLLLKDINIAAATALDTLDEHGRILGLLSGANVVMPNITDTQFRENYQLYEGKTTLHESSGNSRDKLIHQAAAIGEEVLWGTRGDSQHYAARHCPTPTAESKPSTLAEG